MGVFLNSCFFVIMVFVVSIKSQNNPNKCTIKCGDDSTCLPTLLGGRCKCNDLKKSYHDEKCVLNCNYKKCGENAKCVTSKQGYARCKCIKGFAGDPNKICEKNPCEVKNPCGENAECYLQDDNAHCKCKDGFVGYPGKKCFKLEADVCNPNPCGENSGCVNGTIPRCYCLKEFKGNPPNCFKPCQNNEECSKNEICDNYTGECKKGCRDDGGCKNKKVCQYGNCIQKCQQDGDCNNNEFCDYDQCVTREINPWNCGLNSKKWKDKLVGNQDVCYCEDGFVPEPIYGCRKLRVKEQISCKDEKCTSDCEKFCAKDAICTFQNGTVGCYCSGENYRNPFISCTSEEIWSPPRPHPTFPYSPPYDGCRNANKPECAVEISPHSIAILSG